MYGGGCVGNDQPVMNHPLLFGSDLSIHPGFIMKEDSRYSEGCTNHYNCDARHILGDFLIS